MLEQQFLTFLVERLDSKLEELRTVEEARKVTVEMSVFTEQLRSVIEQIYSDDTVVPQSAAPQRTAPRRSSRRSTASEQQKTAD